MKKIKDIVITGGPCAGKSSAMKEIQKHYEQKGYRVLSVAETATELINSNIAPWSTPTPREFQSILFELQKQKERIYQDAANRLDDDKVLIVYDRGLLDNHAYLSDEDFQSILDEQDMKEPEILDRYDAVFCLESTANGAEDLYTLENNSARYENLEDAKRVDDRAFQVWEGHPKLFKIGCEPEFEKKMEKLFRIMDEVLEPESTDLHPNQQ